MNIYNVTVILHGHNYMEDPDCPLSWRGSGVYDIRIGYEQKVEARLSADSKEQAIEMVENYRYDSHHNCGIIIDDVEIDEIELEGEDPDGDDPDVYDISFFDAEFIGRI